ncbi:MAG: Nickel transport protein NikQ [Syntrophorhabdus sp. PtaU1.Bin153]|nr:MAG: Nickel transport protein NikQ [Syntrophorhabdus sp. PtaU1.Bin153]
MKNEIPDFLLSKPHLQSSVVTDGASRISFLDKGVGDLSRLIKTTYIQWETAEKNGFFQNLDARVKVLFLLLFVIIVSVKQTLLPEVIIAGFVCILAALSRLSLISFYKRVVFFGFIFGFLVALPSALNIVSHGEIVLPVIHLPQSYDFLMYHIPETIGFTRHGLEGVVMLTLRVLNSLALSVLVIYTTPFVQIIKALKSLKVPDLFLMILTLSYKYIFIFVQTVEHIHLAKKAKTIQTNAGEERNWVAGRIAYLFRKTSIRCEEVFDGMTARGFTGDVVLYAHRKMTKKDVIAGSILLVVGVGLLML